VAKDAMVKNVFLSYGHAEGCAMCFALATSSSISSVLRNKAVEAALCYANRPLMKLTGPSAGEGMDPISSYTFQPSSLYEGLVRIFSRLLRPFWYKPAVVVTEGGPIHCKSAYANYYSSLPAKVELLLDDLTLGQIRRPLILLQNVMKNTFLPAVQTIPGVSNKERAGADAMDVDEVGYSSDDGGLITRAMQHQSRASATAQMMNNPLQAQFASIKELQACAFRTEDRNMHSLYRLLSRCVQMLNLISCLKHAHEIPALPEVQWGLLHGLTFYQLVSTHEGQERIETLLNALVSQGEKTFGSGFSTDGDILAETLSHQCYLFFSSASRLTYLGFRSANDALSRPFTSPQRITLSNQAASYLRAASRHWYAPALVAGRLASQNSRQGWEDVAKNAKEAGSPLALAADILMELRNVEGLADVCLICASNFGGSKVPCDERKECCEDVVQDMLGWERGLYHRPSTSKIGGADSMSAGAQAIVAGIDVTVSDALNTCHSIIFHHISVLLKDGNESNQRLAEDLVATCAASSDVKFLHSLYEHLLATNEQIVLRIDSSSLEDWLLNKKKDINLLWNYYSFHGRHVLAGDIMWEKAVDTEGKISLDLRIECLTRAANSFSSSLDANHSAFNMRGLVGGGFPRGGTSQTLEEQRITVETLRLRNDQIQEQLDVATIQKRILTTISQSQNSDLEPAKIDALKFTLVNISDLYNDYACPLNLFDVCLLIFETCRRNDFDTINMLWKSIICEEILPCQTNSDSVVDFLTRLKQGSLLEEEAIVYSDGAANDLQPFETGEWIPRLRNRVTTLGKELFGKGADYTFPIDLVVRQLEGTTVDNLYVSMLRGNFSP
jgi:nuclear pore complex protein Nup155